MPPVHELREVAQSIRRLATVTGAKRAIVTSSRTFYSLAKLFQAEPEAAETSTAM